MRNHLVLALVRLLSALITGMFYCSPVPASVCQLVTTEVQQEVGRVQEKKQCHVSQLETCKEITGIKIKPLLNLDYFQDVN